MAKAEALDAYRAGRVSLRELGRTLGLDVWGTHDLLASEGVAVSQDRREESRGDMEAAIEAARVGRDGGSAPLIGASLIETASE